jgi:hypothetical protein
MSAKKEKNVWQSCQKCSTIMPYQDVIKHDKEQCSTINLSGYVLNQVFRSTNLEFKTRSEDLKKLNANQLNKFIFIAATAIKLCHLKIGDFVEVELNTNGTKTNFVKQIWPESDIFGAKTFLNKEGK